MRDAAWPAPETPTTQARRRTKRAGDREIFFRHWLRDPLSIGAAIPSGTRVARAMARELILDRPGVVLELGAGTGGITRGLIEAGCPIDRLITIERERELAAHLARCFHGLRIIVGDALQLDEMLDDAGVDTLATVVSSLPIKWFPRDGQRAILEACFARLGSGGSFIQLTNAFASPIPVAAFGLVGEEVTRIWAHFLPVQIWRYRRAAGADERVAP